MYNSKNAKEIENLKVFQECQKLLPGLTNEIYGESNVNFLGKNSL